MNYRRAGEVLAALVAATGDETQHDVDSERRETVARIGEDECSHVDDREDDAGNDDTGTETAPIDEQSLDHAQKKSSSPGPDQYHREHDPYEQDSGVRLPEGTELVLGRLRLDYQE